MHCMKFSMNYFKKKKQSTELETKKSNADLPPTYAQAQVDQTHVYFSLSLFPSSRLKHSIDIMFQVIH